MLTLFTLFENLLLASDYKVQGSISLFTKPFILVVHLERVADIFSVLIVSIDVDSGRSGAGFPIRSGGPLDFGLGRCSGKIDVNAVLSQLSLNLPINQAVIEFGRDSNRSGWQAAVASAGGGLRSRRRGRQRLRQDLDSLLTLLSSARNLDQLVGRDVTQLIGILDGGRRVVLTRSRELNAV